MRSALFLGAIVLGSAGVLHGQSLPVAGTAPDRRPEGAPRVERFEPDAAWLARFHYGVSEPLPPHLGARDQGAWYTPFNRPGMLPPYDLRGWHEATPEPR